jgi:hypothetical protein
MRFKLLAKAEEAMKQSTVRLDTRRASIRATRGQPANLHPRTSASPSKKNDFGRGNGRRILLQAAGSNGVVRMPYFPKLCALPSFPARLLSSLIDGLRLLQLMRISTCFKI